MTAWRYGGILKKSVKIQIQFSDVYKNMWDRKCKSKGFKTPGKNKSMESITLLLKMPALTSLG